MALASKMAPEEIRKEAARLMGSVKSERKAAAARANGFKVGHDAPGGRKPAPLLSISCTCTAGEATEGHRWDCPRGQAVKRRLKEGRDLMTGEKLNQE